MPAVVVSVVVVVVAVVADVVVVVVVVVAVSVVVVVVVVVFRKFPERGTRRCLRPPTKLSQFKSLRRGSSWKGLRPTNENR